MNSTKRKYEFEGCEKHPDRKGWGTCQKCRANYRRSLRANNPEHAEKTRRYLNSYNAARKDKHTRYMREWRERHRVAWNEYQRLRKDGCVYGEFAEAVRTLRHLQIEITKGKANVKKANG